jgi:hypothetical protein
VQCAIEQVNYVWTLKRSEHTLDSGIYLRSSKALSRCPDAQNNYPQVLLLRLILFSNRFGISTLANPVRSPPCHYLLFLCCASWHLRASRESLPPRNGSTQHVVDYSYSHPDYRRRFTAVSTARAMPARAMPKGRCPGGFSLGRSFSTYRVFFYDLRRNRFDVRKYGVERDGGKKPR